MCDDSNRDGSSDLSSSDISDRPDTWTDMIRTRDEIQLAEK
jgi:hypothetical protein